MTLLELAIILSIVGVLVFIALPTLRQTGDEANIDFAKEQLLYLHGKEQEYFALHGKYAPISKLGQDPTVGREFDKRFSRDEINVEGIQFNGPKSEQATYEIVAALPRNGPRYKVDQSGQVTALP